MYVARLLCQIGVLAVVDQLNGACTWPAEFWSSQWHDSSRGILTFTDTSMQGWTITPTTGFTLSSWDCASVSSYNTDGRMIMVTSEPFGFFGLDLYAYLCITVTKVTDSSYRYYIENDIEPSANYDRFIGDPVDTLTDQGIICSDSGASGGEYQMLILEGSESSARVDCPWHFLGRYGYTHTTSSGTTTCDSATSEINMCTDTQQMAFNYTTCPTKVANSVSDSVWCVGNIAAGGTNYVMLFNGNDAYSAINNQDVFRFSCMAVSVDATTASVAPRYCQKGQTPDQYPQSASGTPMGAVLTFSKAAETCPTCPGLSDPPYGNVSISTTGSEISALYACAADYTLWGSCGIPAMPSNGAVDVNSDGSIANYTCDMGYTLNGMVSRNCQLSSATWEGSDTTCTECGMLSTINGQTFTFSTNGTITTVSFTCASGYFLSGSVSMDCSADGTWDSQQPNCVVCDTLTNIASGSVALSTDGSSTTAIYTCANGYTLQGDATRTCQLDGTWDGTGPTCICNQPNSPSNGALVANGTFASYTCNVGFTLDGETTITCQNDGSGWSDTDPQCAECGMLSTITGQTSTFSTNGTITTVSFTCASGYFLSGSVSMDCSADGTWDSQQPNCDSDESDTGAGSNWSVPIVAMVIVILVILILFVQLGVFVHLYCRLKKRSSPRVPSAVSRERI